MLYWRFGDLRCSHLVCSRDHDSSDCQIVERLWPPRKARRSVRRPRQQKEWADLGPGKIVKGEGYPTLTGDFLHHHRRRVSRQSAPNSYHSLVSMPLNYAFLPCGRRVL